MNDGPAEDIDEQFYVGHIDETIFDETWRVLSQWLAMDKNRQRRGPRDGQGIGTAAALDRHPQPNRWSIS